MNKKPAGLLNIYFTAGYPNLEDTGTVIQALDNMGVDIVEIGMPYSDPLADGPTIQKSGAIALENGMTLPLLFEQIKAVRPNTEMPIILMGYFNQVMQYGVERFLSACQQSGVDALILPDMPLEVYEESYRELYAQYGLESIFLITPQTETDRIRKIDDLGTGFIYMVSSYAITGAKKGISAAQIAYFERIEAMQLKNPRLIGFGISDRETFNTACAHANGAIIGSAFIRALAKNNSIEAAVSEFVGGLKASSLHV